MRTQVDGAFKEGLPPIFSTGLSPPMRSPFAISPDVAIIYSLVSFQGTCPFSLARELA